MTHRVLCAFAALCLTAASLFGQAVNGTLLGTVTDSSGASVPNARVLITETNTGVSRSGATNDSGNFTFSDLPPGRYKVSVEQTGFRTSIRENVDVLVNSTARADLQLTPGQVSETIDVTAEAPMLQTDRSDTGRKIETKQIEDLPLSGGHNFQSLIGLVPGASAPAGQHSVSSIRKAASQSGSTASRGWETICSSKGLTTTSVPGSCRC